MATGASPRGGLQLGRAVRELYQAGQTDYSLEPVVLTGRDGRPLGRIQDGDAVVFCCRRGEREVELTEAFTAAEFSHFPRPARPHLDFVILTLYHEKFKDLPVAFAPAEIPDTLGEVVSRHGLRQLRTAESEKFAHVTFFLDGGRSQAFPGEEAVRIPSPRGRPFDQVPELSLGQVAEQVVQAVQQPYDLIVANFANGDVIGHTANAAAKVQCAECVDAHLGRVIAAAHAAGCVCFITADHGNLETLFTDDGAPHVAHTTNPVPFITLDPCATAPIRLHPGRLADVAPTVLAALGLPIPASMTGVNLAPAQQWGGPRRVLLVILDGWGIGRADASNPIYLARTPVWDRLLREQASTGLQAAGEAVGLQAGKAGNSEAGHMNLGAGRVVLQDDVRLDQAIKSGTFADNPILRRTLAAAQSRSASLHLIGLLTEKSSHGSLEYPLALLRMAKAQGLERVYLHMILDGRSTAPGSAPALLEKLEAQMEAIGLGQVVTGVGRGLALDRDGNYAKIQRTYDALVSGAGAHRQAREGSGDES